MEVLYNPTNSNVEISDQMEDITYDSDHRLASRIVKRRNKHLIIILDKKETYSKAVILKLFQSFPKFAFAYTEVPIALVLFLNGKVRSVSSFRTLVPCALQPDNDKLD